MKQERWSPFFSRLPGIRGILARLDRLEARLTELAARAESRPPETAAAAATPRGSVATPAEGFPIYLDYPVAPKSRYTLERPHRLLYDLLEAGRPVYEARLQHMAQLLPYLGAIPKEAALGSTQPYWANGWFPGLDSLTLYTILTELRPARYLEVGSGNSTRFARRAVSDQHLTTEIVSIDPEPRAEVDRICDRIMRTALEDADLGVFEGLEAGDVLFIDSSHRIFQNSDVTIVLLDVLPYLKPGVWIHFHDIRLPYDYPDEWLQRYYSEQYGIAALLLADAGRRYAVEMANAFISRDAALQARLDDLVLRHLPAAQIEPYGASLWLRVRA